MFKCIWNHKTRHLRKCDQLRDVVNLQNPKIVLITDVHIQDHKKKVNL